MTISISLNQSQVVITAPQTSSVKKVPRKRNHSSRRVSFVPYVTSFHDKSNEIVVDDRWYGPQDYDNFKQKLQRDIASFNTADPKSTRIVEEVMKACHKASDRYDTVCFTDFSELLPNGLESLFQKCVQKTPYTIGLHKFCIKYLVRDRKSRQSEMVSTVLQTQSPPWSPMGSGIVPEGVCQRISRPSRLFSQIIAQAAAKAA